MTRMGLRNFTCLVPSEPLDSSHEWRDSEEEMEGAAGTSYEVSSSSYADHRKFKSSSSDHSDRINCSSGSTNVFACFRAGAINLIVHPAMASMGHPKKGVSAVQPVNSLPRTAFMEGAAEHQSGEDPTSPVVTCIGQVRVKPMKATKSPEKSMEGLMDLKNLKSIRKDNKLQRIEGPFSAPSSPRPSRWKQFLGAKGTVNPSLQNSPEKEEFQIDLNRFSSACSSIAKTTPCFKDMKGRTHTGAFLAKSLMMLQLDCEEREEEEKELKHSTYEGSDNKVKEDSETGEQGSFGKPAVNNNILAKGANVEEPLWKRRSGAKPLTLDLKKQNSHDR